MPLCRKILGGLAAGGLLQGDLQEMIEAEVGGLFMPHGALQLVISSLCIYYKQPLHLLQAAAALATSSPLSVHHDPKPFCFAYRIFVAYQFFCNQQR